MYQEVFDFSGRPFTMAPFVKHFFDDGPVNEAVEQINESINRDAGPAVIIGQHGTGKSLLLALLAEQHQQRFKVISLTCGPMSERRDLLQAILFELKQPYRDLTEGELRLSLIDYIKPTENCPNGVLLLVDDAQSMTPDLVDELRLITNFVRDGVPRVRLVLCGTDRLEEVLTEPKLEPFNQRVSARCYLSNLTRDQTRAYVHQHIARVGGNAQLMFEEATTNAIHEATCGCPRFINQLCEQCMIYAATHGSLIVEPQMVEPAWAHVQGLPAPDLNPGDCVVTQENDDNWTVIEFGSLDDDDVLTDTNQLEAQPETEPHNIMPELADHGLNDQPIVQDAGPPNAEPEIVDESDAATEFDDQEDHWDDLVSPDPYVAQEPELENRETDIQPETDEDSDSEPSTYSYQQLDPDLTSDEDETETSHSIPTEIQSLNEDQQATWSAAGYDNEPADNELSHYQPEEDSIGSFEGPEFISPDTLDSETSANPDTLLSEGGDTTEHESSDHQNQEFHEETSFASETVANPFAETFESEEPISNEFSQLIAEQNSSSALVTGEQLDQLADLRLDGHPSEHAEDVTAVESKLEIVTPVLADSSENGNDDSLPETSPNYESNDASDHESLEMDSNTEDDADAFSSGDLQSVFNSLIESDASDHQSYSSSDEFTTESEIESSSAGITDNASLMDTTDSQPGDTSFELSADVDLENGFYSATSEIDVDSTEQNLPLDETEFSTVQHSADQHDPEPAQQFHEHVEHQPTTDIQRKADQILSALEDAPSEDVVEAEIVDKANDQIESPADLAASAATDDPIPHDELSEAQQILSEILEQKNLVSDHVREPSDAESQISQPEEPGFPQSLPISQTLSDPTPHDTTDDDADIIVVSELGDAAESSSTPEGVASESNTVSIGRAERMDYESLFERLRDAGNDGSQT